MELPVKGTCISEVHKKVTKDWPPTPTSTQSLRPPASINKYCLFKQFKNAYDRGTVIFHGVTAKSSGITIIFFQIIYHYFLA